MIENLHDITQCSEQTNKIIGLLLDDEYVHTRILTPSHLNQ